MPTSETQRTKKMTKEDKKRVRHVNSSDEESNDDSSYVDDYDDDDETLGSQDTLSESDYDSESDEDFNDYERPITRRSKKINKNKKNKKFIESSDDEDENQIKHADVQRIISNIFKSKYMDKKVQ